MPTSRSSPAMTLVAGSSRGRGRTPEDQARLGAELEFVRTAGPDAIRQRLNDLVRAGELLPHHDVTGSVDELVDQDASSDIEMDLGDKDTAFVDVWADTSFESSTGELLEQQGPSVPKDAHRLVIDTDGGCTFEDLEFALRFNPRSQGATEELNEISTRSLVLSGLAEWLAVHRQAFLRSKDLADLAPETLDEARRGCAVLQKGLIEMLELETTVREASFSRYLSNCRLAWADGQEAPISILFSREACHAWVAGAVRLFMCQHKLSALTCTPSDVKSAKSAPPNFDAMTQAQFVRWACQRANKVPWAEVLEAYGSRFPTQSSP